ncbi:MAG: DUF5623 domain-containing protein [Zoogloeaceae bacterium]|jgi:hypothetical protein|nr:DUF5623 domain-containing protein [Zoogloeaceae bacterium]
MSNESIRPSSIEGIKRLATSIKREKGIKHLQAMDEAARRAGFQNLRHAQRSLDGNKDGKTPVFRIFLTAYWRDGKSAAGGRETLAINLSAPWTDLLTPAELKSARGLGNFRPEGPDHLATRQVLRSQNGAREAVCHAARTLQFVAATRLRPSSGYARAYPKGNADKRVPAQDHVCIWFDEQKRYLIADEPYDQAAQRNRAGRDSWCMSNGYVELKPSWPGMHNPEGGTRLYLLSDKANGVPLEPIIQALDKLPPPYSASNWKGESAPRLPYFVSPGTIAKADAEATAKENAKQAPRSKASGPRSTVGYVWTMVGPQRRPNARMPIEAHAEVGRLLKSVLAVSYRRKGVYNRVDAIRSELDEWTQREYKRDELPDDKFFDLYYRDCPPPRDLRSLPAEERTRLVENLTQVKTTLAKHYPSCEPLRAMLKRADAAIASLHTWAS